MAASRNRGGERRERSRGGGKNRGKKNAKGVAAVEPGVGLCPSLPVNAARTRFIYELFHLSGEYSN